MKKKLIIIILSIVGLIIISTTIYFIVAANKKPITYDNEKTDDKTDIVAPTMTIEENDSYLFPIRLGTNTPDRKPVASSGHKRPLHGPKTRTDSLQLCPYAQVNHAVFPSVGTVPSLAANFWMIASASDSRESTATLPVSSRRWAR